MFKEWEKKHWCEEMQLSLLTPLTMATTIYNSKSNVEHSTLESFRAIIGWEIVWSEEFYIERFVGGCMWYMWLGACEDYREGARCVLPQVGKRAGQANNPEWMDKELQGWVCGGCILREACSCGQHAGEVQDWTCESQSWKPGSRGVPSTPWCRFPTTSWL